MNVGQLLKAIDNLRAHGLKDHHLVYLRTTKLEPGMVTDACLDSVNLTFTEDWKSVDQDASHTPILFLEASE